MEIRAFPSLNRPAASLSPWGIEVSWECRVRPFMPSTAIFSQQLALVVKYFQSSEQSFTKHKFANQLLTIEAFLAFHFDFGMVLPTWVEDRATRGRDPSTNSGTEDRRPEGNQPSPAFSMIQISSCGIGIKAINPRGFGGQSPPRFWCGTIY